MPVLSRTAGHETQADLAALFHLSEAIHDLQNLSRGNDLCLSAPAKDDIELGPSNIVANGQELRLLSRLPILCVHPARLKGFDNLVAVATLSFARHLHFQPGWIFDIARIAPNSSILGLFKICSIDST